MAILFGLNLEKNVDEITYIPRDEDIWGSIGA